MADNAKDAWNEVSDRFTSWGRMVADRYRERQTDSGASSEETGRKLDEAARELSEQLNRAFTALGDTLRDAEAKDRLKDAVRSLGDAVSLTVNETTDELRKRWRPSTAGDDQQPDTGGTSTPPPPPASPPTA